MNPPHKHTPYDGSSKPFTIGLSQLDHAEWIEVDDLLEVYLTEKHRLYQDETRNVLVAEPGTEAAQQEVLDMLVDHLAKYFPEMSRHPGDGHESALARAALLVQEDLVLMRKSPEGWRLVAASLCFPSAWNLLEKFGKPLHAIHGPVPGFNTGTRNAGLIDRMFDNLRPDHSVLRWNWSLYGDAKLYHPATDHGMKKRFGDGNLEGRVTLRLERQTLRKLPKSGDILFTIRIHLDPLEVLARLPNGKELAQTINEQIMAMTEAEISYKGFADARQRLSHRLREIAG
jgi:dimethylamine monooxygenase subunit A